MEKYGGKLNKKYVKIIVLLSFIIISILFLSLFAVGYYYVLDKINYGVISLDEYKNNPPCELKRLDEGWVQLSNCAKYIYVGKKR